MWWSGAGSRRAYTVWTILTTATILGRLASTAPISLPCRRALSTRSVRVNVLADTLDTRTITFEDDAIDFQRGVQWGLASDGGSRFTTDEGAKLVFSFTGRQFKIYGAKNSQGAPWSLRIDDQDLLTMSSFRDGSISRGVLLFDSGNSLGEEDKSHEVTIEKLGNGRDAMDFQKVEVMSLAATPSTSEAPPASASTPAFSSLLIPGASATPAVASGSSLSTQASASSPSARGQSASDTPQPPAASPSTAQETSIAEQSSSPNAVPSATSAATPLPAPGTGSTISGGATDGNGSAMSAVWSDSDDLANMAADASRSASGSPNLALIVPLAIILPLLVFGAVSLLVYRYYSQQRRRGRVLRWSKQKGLRMTTYDMDFACNGDDELGEGWSRRGSAQTAGRSEPPMTQIPGSRSGASGIGRAL